MRNLLFITMLLGVGYSQDCDPAAETGWNCDCNEDTWQEYYNSENHDMEGCWLPRAYLYMANLSNANLSEADLSYSNLMSSYLYGAHISWSNLAEANLEGANLEWANLSNANLSYVNLEGTFLQHADLEGANLSWADLSWTNLFGTDLCNLTGSPSGDVCEQGITDENNDGYDDASYETGAESGDLNLDGSNNILDVVSLVNIILNP